MFATTQAQVRIPLDFPAFARAYEAECDSTAVRLLESFTMSNGDAIVLVEDESSINPYRVMRYRAKLRRHDEHHFNSLGGKRDPTEARDKYKFYIGIAKCFPEDSMLG